MTFALSHKFTFWVKEIDREKEKYEDYGSNLKAVATVADCTEFWQFFQYLKSMNELSNCDIYLFKHGVKPEWEDQGNVGGGYFRIKIDKKKTNKLWENAVFSTITPKNTFVDVMSGLRLKIRDRFDEMEIWLNSGSNERQKLQNLKIYLRENLQITEDKIFGFIPFPKLKND